MTSPEFARSGGDVDDARGRSEDDDDDVVDVVVLGASSDVSASPAGAA
jgi:hypothetical protein